MIRATLANARSFDSVTFAMTLLTGARVMAYMDLASAKAMLEEGVSLLRLDALPAHLAAHLRDEIYRLAVPVDPAFAVRHFTEAEDSPCRTRSSAALIRTLLAHGERKLALDLYEDPSFEADGAGPLLAAEDNEEVRANILRDVLERSVPWPPGKEVGLDCPFQLFAMYFQDLPWEEAQECLNELLLRLETMPDSTISYASMDRVQLTNRRDMHLFQLLPALRMLCTELEVEQILRARPAVQEAAAIFPLGISTRIEPVIRQLVPKVEAKFTAPPPMAPHLLDEAHHLYCDDLRSNGAPRVLWPSCRAYCTAMHYAATQQGRAGERLLSEIPDTVLAARAAIEFAAGLLEIPPYLGLHCQMPLEPLRRLRAGHEAWRGHGAGAA